MSFCDFDLINKSFERKRRFAKGRAKKKHAGEACFRGREGEWDQVTGAGLNTAS